MLLAIFLTEPVLKFLNLSRKRSVLVVLEIDEVQAFFCKYTHFEKMILTSFDRLCFKHDDRTFIRNLLRVLLKLNDFTFVSVPVTS